jgi:hypothetical protein
MLGLNIRVSLLKEKFAENKGAGRVLPALHPYFRQFSQVWQRLDSSP